MTQNAGILAMLHAAGSEGVTPLEALQVVGCFRLAARIAELRAEGWAIENKGKGHARYVLLRDATPWMAPPVTETEQRALWGDR